MKNDNSEKSEFFERQSSKANDIVVIPDIRQSGLSKDD